MTERRFRFHSLLALLVVATALPVTLFSSYLVWRSWNQQGAMIDRQNIDLARAISVTVDGEIHSTATALGALAALDPLDGSDLPAARTLILRFLDQQPHWAGVALVSPDGRVLLDTADASPADRRIANPALSAAVTGLRPSVSDFYRDSAGVPSVLIAVPVVRNGAVRSLLVAQLRTISLSNVLRAQRLPTAGVVTLLDRQGLILARSRNEDRYAGKPPTAAFTAQAKGMNEGALRTVLLEGEPAYGAISRSPFTGWTVGLGFPASEIDGPMRRNFTQLGAVGLAFLGLGLALSFGLGRLTSNALAACAAAAGRLARGEPLAARPSRVVEIDRLARSLGESAVILEARQRERDEAAAERAREHARAEELGRAKDEFIATLSHELRNPLNAILGWVRLLRDTALDPPARAHGLEVIERNTRLQAQLVDDLLDMSRVISGKLRLEMRPVDLGKLADEACDAIGPTAAAKEITLARAGGTGPFPIMGDADRLHQILWNLLTNAVKFTPKGGRVEVELSSAASEVRLRVSDSGIGIDPGLLPHVFERFRQGVSTAAREHGGLGIGLALVRHLVELHGGDVTAESDGAGRGARFTVTLPKIGEPALLMGGGLERDGAASAAPPRLDGVAVLVVEDDPDARELIAVTLANAGATVSQAASVSAALEALAANPPQVLVSDIAMPTSTGYDLIAAVRTLPRLRGLPSIALTAYGRSEDRQRSLDAGFDLHLGKPVEPAALVRAVALLAARTVRA
jgi:signal transduction histidine kinase/CheY-like chemotaxis protein